MRLAELIADHGDVLVLGLSVLLALAAWAVLRSRRVADAQRWAELGLLVGLLYVPLALAPLPRWSLDALFADDTRATPVLSAADRLRSRTEASVDRLLADMPAATVRHLDTQRELTTSAPAAASAAPVDVDVETLDRARQGLSALASTLTPAPATPPATHARPSTSAPRSSALQPGLIIAWLYLAGVTLGVLRLGLGAWRLRRVVRDTRPAPAEIADLLVEGAWPGHDAVRLRVTDREHGPFCVGVRRPIIVLPASLIAPERRDALLPVLCHELAHAARRDGIGRWIAALALPCLWFHPLAWWLRARARRASELLADDLAAAHTSARRTARALVELASRRLTTPAPALHSSSVLDGSHDLTRRIDMLLNRTGRLDTPTSRGQRWLRNGLAATALALGTTLLGAPAQAQDARTQDEIALLNEERSELLAELESLQHRLREMQQLMLDMQAVQADESFTDAEKLPMLGFLFSQDERAQPTAAPADETLAELRALGYVAEPVEPVEDPLADGERLPLLSDIPILAALMEPQPFATKASDPTRPHSARAAPAQPLASAGSSDELAVSGAMLDLITRHIDMGTELAIKERNAAEDEPLVEGGFLSEGEWRTTLMEIEGLALKRSITEQLLVAELQAAELELSQLRDADSPRVVRLRARIQVITSVL